MSLEEMQQLEKLVNHALRDPLNFPWFYFCVAIALVGLASFLGAYLAEKAKNTALKEDLENLTHTVEGITAIYTQHTELYKAQLQFRNVALADRLKAHQEAYALWFKMFDRVWDEDRNQLGHLFQTCRSWWAEHCLYLAPEARERFLDAINRIMMHREYRGTPDDGRLLQENWKEIQETGNALAKAVELPQFHEVELLKMPSATFRDLRL